MIILHITEPAGGGSFAVIKHLALRQRADGCEVFVLHGHRDLNTEDVSALQTAGVNCSVLNDFRQQISPLKDVKTCFEIRAHLKSIAVFVNNDVRFLHAARLSL